MTNFIVLIKQYLPLFEVLALSLILSFVSSCAVNKIIKTYFLPLKVNSFNTVIFAIKRSAFIIFLLLYFNFFSYQLNLPIKLHFIETVVNILSIIALSLMALKLLDYIDIWLERKKYLDKSTNVGMLITRAFLLKKILRLIILILAVAMILLNFSAVKEIGKGILISAGVLGGILAFAAQKIFSNIFSSMSFILNSPIQVGDIIRIDAETGTVEKITLNQIQIRTWDLRLLIYPLDYFFKNPFQNLSHLEQGLLGTVFLYTDYKVDIEKIRYALLNILQSSTLWDKKTNSLQITAIDLTGIQLRALIGADNVADLWNLCCYVREHLIVFIQNNCPEVLPRERIQLDGFNYNEKIVKKGIEV